MAAEVELAGCRANLRAAQNEAAALREESARAAAEKHVLTDKYERIQQFSALTVSSLLSLSVSSLLSLSVGRVSSLSVSCVLSLSVGSVLWLTMRCTFRWCCRSDVTSVSDTCKSHS